jgi:hypothetical protein
MMPLTNEDAAALALPGRTATVGKRQTIPSTNRLPRILVHQQLGDRFFGAVRRLGHHRGVVRHDGGKNAAVNGERAREDEARWCLEAAARFEKRAWRRR